MAVPAGRLPAIDYWGARSDGRIPVAHNEQTEPAGSKFPNEGDAATVAQHWPAMP